MLWLPDLPSQSLRSKRRLVGEEEVKGLNHSKAL